MGNGQGRAWERERVFGSTGLRAGKVRGDIIFFPCLLKIPGGRHMFISEPEERTKKRHGY